MKYFRTISEYCEAINIRPPKREHFDIRNFKDNKTTIVQKMPAFRHEFYTIAIRKKDLTMASMEELRTGNLQELAVNSPTQTLSWEIMPDWDGFYLMFSSSFAAQSNLLQEITSKFPFLNLTETIPFEVSRAELKILHALFEQIAAEYHSAHPDAMQLIEANVYLMLLHINRCYQKNDTD